MYDDSTHYDHDGIVSIILFLLVLFGSQPPVLLPVMFQSPTWDSGSSIWIPHESPAWSPSPLALAPAFTTRVQQWVFQTSSPGRLFNIQQFRQAETGS